MWRGGGHIHGQIFVFENTIFCSSNCNILRFSSHNLALLLIFLLFFFNKNNECTYNCQYTHFI